jgi:hypothetical protein
MFLTILSARTNGSLMDEEADDDVVDNDGRTTLVPSEASWGRIWERGSMDSPRMAVVSLEESMGMADPGSGKLGVEMVE